MNQQAANGSVGAAQQNSQQNESFKQQDGQGLNRQNSQIGPANPAEVMAAIGKIVDLKQNEYQNQAKVNPDQLNRTADQLMEQTLKLIPQNKQHLFLTTWLVESIKPVKFFDPNPQPQDISSLLGQVTQIFFQCTQEISADITRINEMHVKTHVAREAQRQIYDDIRRQLIERQQAIYQEMGIDPSTIDVAQIDAQSSAMQLTNLGEAQLDQVKSEQQVQLNNIDRLQKTLLQYSQYQKLHSGSRIQIKELLTTDPDEKVWPSPQDLSQLDSAQIRDLKVCALHIVQKNSSRSRGEEWGNAFFLRLKLDQGIESPIMGQDEWEEDPQKRPELNEYSMRECNKIIVSYKEGMVIAVFFYLRTQENYKNVLASAECFAGINYEQMLKDPHSKGCILETFEIPTNKRWVGMRYKEQNRKPASRYYTRFEPIIIDKQ